MVKKMVILVLFLLSTNIIHAGRLTYEKFLELNDDQKQKVAQRYVKKDGEYFKVILSSYLVYCNVDPVYTVQMAVLMDDFYKRFSNVFKERFIIRKRPKLYVL